MKKPQLIYGFFMVYFGLIGISYISNTFLFQEVFTNPVSSAPLVTAIAQSSLTAVNEQVFGFTFPVSYLVFSLAITQLSGITFLTFLLWLYWQLFDSNRARSGLGKAFKLTVTISLITELFLLLFFLYAIPIEQALHSNQNKFIAALMLSIGSFNNAGLSLIEPLLAPGFREQNYVMQIGVIFGTTMGSLGIFVIDELLSPKKLRQRLDNPDIDWSLITKISIYGTGFILIVFSGIFYLNESNNYLGDKNLIESLIASVYEISSARGLGNFFATKIELPSSSFLKLLATIVGSGPFSTGGGLTLLSLTWMYAFFIKKDNKSSVMKKSIKLAKNLLFYSLIAFAILSFFVWFVVPKEQYGMVVHDLWLQFSTNHINLWSPTNFLSDMLVGITCISGRIVFLLAATITLKQYTGS